MAIFFVKKVLQSIAKTAVAPSSAPSPAPVQVPATAQAEQVVAKPQPPTIHPDDDPTTGKDSYTILDALEDLASGKRKGVLMLCKIKEQYSYRVMHYDRDTHKVQLKNPDGGILTPIVGQREVPLYRPVWR